MEAPMRLVLQFNEAYNLHDVTGMARLISDDCAVESAHPGPAGTRYSGKAALIKYWTDCFLAAPRAHLDIEEIFGLGERCVVRWSYSADQGVREGGYVRGVDLFRVRGGLIIEQLSYLKG
jgi:predicted SnoaL-like aldol condensation-catalyzing enzyme